MNRNFVMIPATVSLGECRRYLDWNVCTPEQYCKSWITKEVEYQFYSTKTGRVTRRKMVRLGLLHYSAN